VIAYPNIDPVIFELPAVTLFDLTLGPFPLRWYAVSYIIGIGLGYLYARSLSQQSRLYRGTPATSPAILEDYLTWVVLFGILGGRIGYVLFYNLPFYTENPLNALMIWQGGMSFHGGLIGVVLSLIVYGQVTRRDPWRIADVMAAAAGIPIISVRIANFINGELFGRVTDVPWAMVFPHGGPEPRHPSQLYQAAMEGLLVFIALRVATHRFQLLERRGAVAGLFLICYGLARIIGEVFRQPDAQIGFLLFGLTMGMLLSLPLIGFGLVLWRYGRHWPAAPNARP
jgi:phosphatidylglycerol:prolipoprotein diacylglycerol transferase